MREISSFDCNSLVVHAKGAVGSALPYPGLGPIRVPLHGQNRDRVRVYWAHDIESAMRWHFSVTMVLRVMSALWPPRRRQAVSEGRLAMDEACCDSIGREMDTPLGIQRPPPGAILSLRVIARQLRSISLPSSIMS